MDYEPIFSKPETPESIDAEIDTIYDQFCLAVSKLPEHFTIIKALSISHLQSILESISEIKIYKPETYISYYKRLENKVEQTILEIQSTLPGVFLKLNSN
jgi:hypothetical protein